MEPVHGHIRSWEVSLDGRHKAARYVTNDLKHSARVVALVDEVLPKLLNSLLALTFSGKDHRAVVTIQINETCYIAMPAFAGSLVEAACLEPAEVNALHGDSHVTVDDSPKSLVRRTHTGGNGGHKHLSGKNHDNRLEEQGKVAAKSRPRHLDPASAMVWASYTRHPGSQIAVILEEIQMPPSELLKIIGLAVLNADRAGVGGTLCLT